MTKLEQQKLHRLAKQLNPKRYEEMFPKQKEVKEPKEPKVTQSSIKMKEYNRISQIDEKNRTPEENAYIRKYLGYPEKTTEQKDKETYQKEYKKQQVRLDKRIDKHTESKVKDMKEQIMSAPLNVSTQLKLENAVQIFKDRLEDSGWEREDGRLVKTVNEGEKTKFTKEQYIQIERMLLQVQNKLDINKSNVKKQTNRDIGSIIDELHKAVV